jgi:tetratricopeptide (TPR) repeat protein
MRNIIITICAALAAWALLAGCSKAPGEREFNAAIDEIRDGNYVRAKTLLEKSISKRPGSEENALAYNYLGIAAWRLGKFQEAMDAFEDSRRLSPALVEPVYNQGVLLAGGGDVPRAILLLTEAARMDPADPRALEVLGSVYTDRQQWPEARRALYGALDRDPNSERILAAIALVEAGSGDYEKAIASLMKALDNNSKYAPALFTLGVLYETRLRDNEQAETYYKKFLTAARKDTRVPHVKEALARLGSPVATEPAPAPVTKPVATAKETPAATTPPAKKEPVTFDELLKEAAVLSEKGQAERAIELCLKAADISAKAKKPEQQEKALRTAARLCFDQPRAHVELGQYLLGTGKTDAALKSFKQAVVLDNTYAAAYLGMALAAIRTGESDAAVVGLRQAVKYDPKNPEASWMLAMFYDEEMSNVDLAIKAYRDFAQQFPDDERAVRAQSRIEVLLPKPHDSHTPPAVVTAVPQIVEADTNQPARIVEAPGDDIPPPEVVTTAPPRPSETKIKYRKPTTRNTKAAVQAFNQGTRYQDKKDWDRAIYYYLRSLENDDMIASTFYNLAVAYTAKSERSLSREAYLRALALQPDMVNARYNLALIYREEKDLASAAKLLEAVVQSKPDHAPAHYVLGLIYSGAPSSYAQAREHYQHFLKLAPNDPAAGGAKRWLESH